MNHIHSQSENQKAAHQSLKPLARHVFCFVLGLLILASGVSFSVKSDLGVSPVSSLPYVYSRILDVDMGITTAALFSLYVFAQILLLRRQYQWKNLLQLPVGLLFGTFVSLTNRLMFFNMPDYYVLRLLFMCISIFLVALGLTLILGAEIAPQPPEGLMLAIQQKSGWNFSAIKVAFDCTGVALAALSSLLFMHALVGVREGTVLSAISIGLVMAQIRKLMGKRLQTFLMQTPADSTEAEKTDG